MHQLPRRHIRAFERRLFSEPVLRLPGGVVQPYGGCFLVVRLRVVRGRYVRAVDGRIFCISVLGLCRRYLWTDRGCFECQSVRQLLDRHLLDRDRCLQLRNMHQLFGGYVRTVERSLFVGSVLGLPGGNVWHGSWRLLAEPVHQLLERNLQPLDGANELH